MQPAAEAVGGNRMPGLLTGDRLAQAGLEHYSGAETQLISGNTASALPESSAHALRHTSIN
jgi:hypothetical protein